MHELSFWLGLWIKLTSVIKEKIIYVFAMESFLLKHIDSGGVTCEMYLKNEYFHHFSLKENKTFGD